MYFAVKQDVSLIITHLTITSSIKDLKFKSKLKIIKIKAIIEMLWDLHHKKVMDLLEGVHRRATNMLRELDDLSHEGRLKE